MSQPHRLPGPVPDDVRGVSDVLPFLFTPEQTKHLERVPRQLREALVRYVEHGTLPGHFLRYCLKNNFVKAVCHADLESLFCLRGIALFLYNEIPQACWGSSTVVENWSKQGGFVKLHGHYWFDDATDDDASGV